MPDDPGRPGDYAAAAYRLPRWLTTEEAAVYCGLHPATLRQAARQGQLQAGRTAPGGHYRFRLDDLDAWLLARRIGAA